MKTRPNYDSECFSMSIKGKGSLKLERTSKDKDKKRIKKEKKEETTRRNGKN
jgi:hypothetical protein